MVANVKYGIISYQILAGDYMFFKDPILIKSFPATTGDCFLIEFIKEDYRILIDGGFGDTYHKYLKNYLLELVSQGKRINLLIITHIDSDHIGGIQAFLKENGSATHPNIIFIDEVWYNAFPHMCSEEVYKQPITYTTKEILKGIIAANNSELEQSNGQKDISVTQGNTVVKLLLEGGYNWNTMWSGKAVCVKNGVHIQLTEQIQCTLLNPGEKELQDLAKFWISKLRNMVKNFVVCNDVLYSEAFESYLMHSCEEYETTRKNIAFENVTDGQPADWEKWTDAWSGQVDESRTNRSSIAFMLEYEGIKMLFPGDAPIQLFRDKLPKEIDVVKLPHHGSEKNISADFIRDTQVSYYILSTDGTKHGHPSKQVIANILYRAPGEPKLLKNYDISDLKEIGVVMGYEHE